jgi:hypothetical protein
MRETTINRIGFAILSVSLVILGAGALAGGGFHDEFYNRYWSFGQHHRLLGVALLAGGAYSGWLAFRRAGSRTPE